MAVPINVCAANQKIKVNPVYQNSKVIKGKTKKIKIRKKHSIQQQMERNIQEKFQNLMIQSIYLQ